MNARFLVVAIILAWHSSAVAAGPRPVTVDDYFSVANIDQTVISPAGDKVAYLDLRWNDATRDRKTDIWIAYANGRPPIRRTHDGAGYDQLTWSPDGQYVYFAGSRSRGDKKAAPYNDTTQVWRLSMDGGEALPLTREPDGISTFKLSADGSAVFFATDSTAVAGEWSTLRKSFDDIQYGEPKSHSTSISKLNLANWRTEKILEYAGYVDDFAVTADQSRLALVTAVNNEVVTLEGQTRLTIVEVGSGATSDLPDEIWRKSAPSPYGRLSSPVWSSDGQVLAFSVGFDGYPSEILIADWTAKPAPKIKQLPRPTGVSLLGGVDGGARLVWRGTTRDLCFLGEQQARIRAYVIPNVVGAADKNTVLTPGDVVVEYFSLSATGDHLAAKASGPAFMPDVYLYNADQSKALTQVNPQAKDWKLPKMEIVAWKGAGGVNVEGVLEVPGDFQPGTEPLPLIVNLHGGPTAAWLYQQYYGYFGSVLYASQGYAFFSPNYRGSTGYGDSFLKDLIGKENDIEVEDILAGIDHLVARKTANSSQIGIAGWSNGGYLTNCLIARRNFAAASSGAGIVDVVQQWGTSDEPALARVFAGGTLWQQPDAYRRFSPIWQLEKAQTPTVIHVSAGDKRCPPGNSRMLYRALRQTLGQRAELLVYPDKDHGLGHYQSRKAKLTWDLAWFDHYLRGRQPPK